MKERVTKILKKITVMSLALAMVVCNLQIANAGTADAKTIAENKEVNAVVEAEVEDPEVKSLDVYLNEEKVSNNFTVKKNDELKFIMDIVAEEEVLGAELEFVSGLGLDAYDSSVQLQLQYDGAIGRYVGILDTAQFDDGEWWLNSVKVTVWRAAGYEYNIEVNLTDYMLYFKIQNGETFETPNYDYSVDTWWPKSMDGSINTEAYEVSTGLMTSWKEIFPDGLPIPEGLEGTEFVSWVWNGELIQYEDEVFLPKYSSEHTNFYIDLNALYDKNNIRISFEYVLSNGKHEFIGQNVLWKMGDTYQDVINRLEYPQEQYEKLTFLEWDYSKVLNGHNLEDEISLSEFMRGGASYIPNVMAVYDELIVEATIFYINEEMGDRIEEEIYVLEKGSTWGNFAQLFLSNEFSLHCKNLTFLEWEGLPEVDDGGIIEQSPYIQSPVITEFLTAVYDENLEQIVIEYDEPDGWLYQETYFIYKNGITYGEIVDQINKLPLKHNSDMQLVGWECKTDDGQVIDLNSVWDENERVTITAVYEDITEGPGGGDTEEPDGGDTEEPSEPDGGDTEEPSEPDDGNTERPGGGNTEEPGTEEPEMPSESLPMEDIEDKVEEVENAKDGDTVKVEMKTNDGKVVTQIPVDVLEAAKGKDVNVVLDMGAYSWTINGQDITAETLKAINLEVKKDTNAIDKVVVDKLADGDESVQISLTHDGEFGFKATLTLNLGKENGGKFGNLYYFEDGKRLVFQSADKIDADGNATFTFSHASDYVIYIGAERTAIPAKGDNNALPFLVFAMGALLVAAGVSKKRLAR